jgi:hypothetical protein
MQRESYSGRDRDRGASILDDERSRTVMRDRKTVRSRRAVLSAPGQIRVQSPRQLSGYTT